MGVLDQRQTTNARADDASDAGGLLFTESLARGQARIAHGLVGGGDAIVDEAVHGPRLFGADVGLQVEPFDLARNLAGKGRCVELGDVVNAGLAGQEVGPGITHRIAHGGDATQAGHDNATTAHA